MAKLVFGMNQSLDGYVDHTKFAPGPRLFRHFIEEARGQAGSVHGRQMYELMRYWDNDDPEWDAERHAFAAAWRSQPKWVVSRSLKSVGPNATLIQDDLEGAIRELKAERDGEIEVAGPALAQSLTELGLIDEVSDLPAPRRAGSRHAVFRRTPAAAPPHGKRPDGRGCGQVDLRSCLISRPPTGLQTSQPPSAQPAATTRPPPRSARRFSSCQERMARGAFGAAPSGPSRIATDLTARAPSLYS